MLKRVSSRLKPLLTEANKAERLSFAASFVINDGIQSRFADMMDTVHVDEKWFFLKRTKTKYYLWHDEEEPLRETKSKNFITKVMFLVAVARPRIDQDSGLAFDGKIGCWPFVVQELALRSSRNRPRGTLETKPIAVTGEVYQRYLTDCVLPAIFAKFPKSAASRRIYIQHDNAGPHQAIDKSVIVSLANEFGWDVSMRSQPPNSPDFNVLDLGFFNSIQSLQYQSVVKTIDELIDAVESAFIALPFDTLARTFITLQKVFDLSIGLQGSNVYKLPHLKKSSLNMDCTTYNFECSIESAELALLRLNCRLDEESSLADIFEALVFII
ncbi:hypothetical protein AeRB84_009211 [Aphanomyces euteiches]|nr:hypothetical protein AeRB84_009211 [Aphanomyces euteiches]